MLDADGEGEGEENFLSAEGAGGALDFSSSPIGKQQGFSKPVSGDLNMEVSPLKQPKSAAKVRIDRTVASMTKKQLARRDM